MRAVEALGLLLLAGAASWQAPARIAEPFVPVAVTYRPELVRDRERAQADLEAIRTLGFNTIRVPIARATAGAAAGNQSVEDVDRVLDSASRSGLKVILQLDASSCRDTGAVLADAALFATATTEGGARHGSLYALALENSPPTGTCSPFIGDRLTQLARALRAKGHRIIATWTAEPAVLRLAAGEASGHDDRAVAASVDLYGVVVPPVSRTGFPDAVALGLALDGVRSAARDKTWMMVEAPSSQPPAAASPLRVTVWSAVSRGARGLIFGEWRVPDGHSGTSLVEPDGTLSVRARAAAGIARVIARNPALFAPLRPRPAKIAVAYGPGATGEFADRYRRLFERNLPTDLVHAEDLEAAASRYSMVLTGSAPADVAAAAKRFSEVRIANASGPLETRFLESSDVLMFIALNHADEPQRVTFTFSPDTQEAIWQNMETGTAVNFVAGPDGPRYSYSFAAKDALVLMIRKDIR